MATNPQNNSSPSNNSHTKEIDSSIKGMRILNQEQLRLAKSSSKLEKAYDDVSNLLIDKTTDALKELAIQSKLLKDTQIDQLKNINKADPKAMIKIIQSMEKAGEQLIAEQIKYKKSLSLIKDQQAQNAKLNQQDAAVIRQKLKLELDEVDLKTDLNKVLTKIVPSFNAATDSIDSLVAEVNKNAKTINKLQSDLAKPSAQVGKAFEGMKKGVLDNIKGFAKFATVMNFAGKAVTELYSRSIELANKGLVGSMMQIQASAVSLRMGYQEFNDLVSKNRETIAALGGGAAGVERFQKMLEGTTKGLEILGKDANNVAATFIKAFNNSGMGPNSGNADISKAYMSNIEELNNQFMTFKGTFGDTEQEFANYYGTILKGEAIQAKINSGDTKNVGLLMKEVMARTENNRLMNISYETMTSMSKRVDDLFNPTKNEQGKAMEERILTSQAIVMRAQEVSKDDPELAKRMMNNIGKYISYTGMSIQGKNKFADDNKDLFVDLAKAQSHITRKRDEDGGAISMHGLAANYMLGLGGSTLSEMDLRGTTLQNAKNYAKQFDGSKTNIDSLKNAANANNFKNNDGTFNIMGDAFINTRKVVETAKAVKDIRDPLTLGKVVNDKFVDGTSFQDSIGKVAVNTAAIFGNKEALEAQKANANASRASRTSSGKVTDISSVLETGSGFNIVQRPDGSIERVDGNRNKRNNNPGNLEYNDYSKKLGAIGSDGRFAIFPSHEVGRKAKESLIFEGKNYKDKTLTDAIARYAPPSENDTLGYQTKALSAVGGQNKAMSSYSSEERKRIMDIIEKHEGSSSLKISQLTPPLINTPISTLQTPSTNAQTTQTVESALSLDRTTAELTELQKQTSLLTAIAGQGSRSSISNRGYQTDQQTALANR